MRSGIISKIERFSLHDGPGIRTLIVMKGCPLKCLWCSSPYTQASHPEMLYFGSKCKGCGRCIEACPRKAVSRGAASPHVKTNRARCRGCGECIATCPGQARELSGRTYTAEALFREVERDAAFYRRSGGGITIGGGEPTAQAGFVREFLTLCRENFFHTAMETSALTSWESLKPLLTLLDLVYIDLKHTDESLHREWTRVSNKLILENIRRAARVCRLIVRVPVVPGFNDSIRNMSATARFLKGLGNGFAGLELLPYHPFGVHHYGELDRNYALQGTEPPSEAWMETLRDTVRAYGVAAEIGG